jgi:hypothetical protein
MVIAFNKIKLNINRGYYRRIGTGSCRKVFDMKNGYVIKMAKNRAGIAQNKSEYEISSKDHSNLFAKVIQASNDFRLLIMEKADKIYDISYVWKHFNVTSKKELLNLKELQNLKISYQLLLGDFNRESSWGVIRGRLVIIDYGFTREVMERYY